VDRKDRLGVAIGAAVGAGVGAAAYGVIGGIGVAIGGTAFGLTLLPFCGFGAAAAALLCAVYRLGRVGDPERHGSLKRVADD